MKTRDIFVFGILGFIIVVGIILSLMNRNSATDEPDRVMDQNAQVVVSELPAILPSEQGSVVDIDTQDSSITWRASKKIIRDWVDEGTLKVTEGSVAFSSDGQIERGAVAIDMTSLAVTQTGFGGDEGADKLTAHLSSADFFDVQQFPRATFVIDQVIPDNQNPETLVLIGDMTIKNITQTISVPVRLVEEAGVRVIVGTVDIDRTQFDVRFGSDKFFDNLGDNVIDDMFSISLSLVLE